MPLAVSFVAACARGLGLGNGEAPLAPSITTPLSDDTTLATPITAAISYTITLSTFPISYVQYKLDKIDSSNNITDGGQWTGSLPGATGSNSVTLTTRVNASGATENITNNQKYALYLRSVDAAGQTGPSSTARRFTTAAEAAPTAATPSIDSSQVSYPTAPFLQFSWGAGTDGTYPIGTRQYSVVAGNNPGAGTYTTLSGSSGTTSVTTTSNGTAIVPGTEYTVYLKYTASNPGSATDTKYATHTTKAEILPSAPNVGISLPSNTDSGRTQIIISRSNVPTPPTPTYQYKYQYAYGLSSNPTGWTDFPTSGTASSVTITGLTNDTTYYARVRAVSLGPSGAPGDASLSGSVATNPPVPPTPTIAWSGMSGSSYGTANFTITNTGGSTTTIWLVERLYDGSNVNAIWRASTTSIGGYSSDGGTRWYVAINENRIGERATSNQLYWTRPSRNQSWSSGAINAGGIYFSTTASCTSEFRYTFGTIPSSDEEPGYIAVTGLSVEGIQQTGTNLNGCSGASYTLANTSYLWWETNSSHPSFGFGISTSGFTTHWSTGTFSARSIALSTFGGSNISNKYFAVGTNLGSRTGGCGVGCSTSTSGGITTLNAYRMRSFTITGIQTIAGSVG